MKKILLILIVFALCTGCADNVSFEQAEGMIEVGFLHGLWHGICFPFSLVGTLFIDDISVYAIYNNGFWYDLGFYLGTSTIIGGSCKK